MTFGGHPDIIDTQFVCGDQSHQFLSFTTLGWIWVGTAVGENPGKEVVEGSPGPKREVESHYCLHTDRGASEEGLSSGGVSKAGSIPRWKDTAEKGGKGST